MVIDCQVLVSVKEKNAAPAAEAEKQSLYPPYHSITLPLNNLNFLFEKITTSFNQTTELTSDKYDQNILLHFYFFVHWFHFI